MRTHNMHTCVQANFEKVTSLKQRLLLYGESTSGKKNELVQRLVAVMDARPPYLGVGSLFHFNKKETVASLEKYCRENHILVDGSK